MESCPYWINYLRWISFFFPNEVIYTDTLYKQKLKFLNKNILLLFTRYTAFIVLYPIGMAPGESKSVSNNDFAL